jgi:hypothetical protein
MTRADSIQDANRYVVDGEHEGSVLPARSAEIGRTVFLRAGARVRGAILAGDVRIENGDVLVQQAVYATRELVVKSGTKPVELRSSSAAKSSILADGRADQAPLIFGADLTAPTVNLSGVVVLGNVYAERAIIRDSAVIGVVHVRQQLQCENSLLGSFTAERAEFAGRIALLLPVAYSAEPIAVGDMSCVIVNDLPSLIQGTETPADGLAFHEEDVKPMWYADPMSGEKRQYHVLSLAGRIANLHDLKDGVERNVEMLRSVSLRDVLHPTVAARYQVSAADLAPALLRYNRRDKGKAIGADTRMGPTVYATRP